MIHLWDNEMSPNKTLHKIASSCLNKHKHKSHGAAMAQVRSLEYYEKGLEPYLCKFCKKWHIGHKREEK